MRILILLFLSLIFVTSFGQDASGSDRVKKQLFKIDSLTRSISGSKKDTVLLKSLIKIGLISDNISVKHPNYHDTSDKYFARAHELSLQIGHPEMYAKRLLRYCSYIDLYNNKPNTHAVRKLRICYQILKIFTQKKDTFNLGTTYDHLFFLYETIGDLEKASQFSRLKYNLLKNTKDIDNLIESNELFALSFRQQINMDSSIFYYQSALLLLEKQKFITPDQKETELDHKTSIINNICELYYEKHNYDTILFLANKYSSLFSQCNGVLESQGYEIIRQGKTTACALRELNKTQEAINVFNSVFARYDPDKDEYKRSWEEFASLHYEFGSTYMKMKDFTKAIQIFNKGLEFSGENFEQEAELLKGSSIAYESLGDLKNAFEIYKKYTSINDSAIILDNKESNIKQAALLGSEFDFKNEIEVEQLENKKQQSIAEEKSKKQQLIIWFTIIGLILLVSISVFIFRSLLLTRKQKKLIEEQKQEVEQQKHIIQEKNKDIIDSIKYARRIQISLLPTEKYISKNLEKKNKN